MPRTSGVKQAAILAGAAGGLLVLLACALLWLRPWDGGWQIDGAAAPNFVGSQACSGCHPTEAARWRQSQHRQAMDHASEASVLGNFNDASLDHAGRRSRFFRQGRKFLVETDGADGKPATFEVKYTFGVYPLQQYLVGFADGRIQALSIAWDARAPQQGGQRWFHLHPDGAVTHDDPLHWTKPSQNWNFMCAECHSTGVHKNYDAPHDRFATSFAEISVGCEACHGAGSRHLAWAGNGAKPDDPARGLMVNFDERAAVSWAADPVTGLPKRSAPPAELRKEVETCGLCHSRRRQVSEDWTPGRRLAETHEVDLLGQEWFEADGQMRDGAETYNYAPFRLSKMFARGVTCSDCHDPHLAKLRSPGDAVCAQCHSPDRYATVMHRHHEHSLPELSCAACHMPLRRYMVIDDRHDHSFRIPRPDLSAQLKTPNACNDCHRDRSAQWAAEKIAGWFGPQRHGYQTYAGAFAAAWTDHLDAQARLTSVASEQDAPALARASAIAALAVPDIELARRGMADPDPMVRFGALDMLAALPPERRWPLASPALSDPVRSVRIRAAELLAAVPPASRPAADRQSFARAASDFIAAQRLNADRPDARLALGDFLARQGASADAEAEYRAALSLDPSFSAATINLADLFRSLGRDSEGERMLRDALTRSDQDAALHFSLGLVLVRLKRHEAALEELRRATELDPSRSRYAYVYAIGLHSAGRRDDALAVLKGNLILHPNDRETLSAAVTFSRETGDFPAALTFAERLSTLLPDDRGLSSLVAQLRRQAAEHEKLN